MHSESESTVSRSFDKIDTSVMVLQKLTPNERSAAREKARSIYETIKPNLDASLKGDIVAIEVGSGEYFVGPTIGEATARARIRHPDMPLHFFRVGFRSVYVWR